MTMHMSDEEMFGDALVNDPVSAMVDAMNAVSKPNYFAIVPAFVRYDKSLTYLEKILYAEISALSNRNGHCFAENKYFADNFGNSEITIRRSIKHLADLGFIEVFMEKMSDQKMSRKIYLVADKFGVATENEKGSRTKMITPKQKKDGVPTPPKGQKVGDNNIVYNSIYPISKDIDKPAQANATKIMPEVSTIPIWLGSTPLLRLLKLYELMFEYTLKTDCEKIKIASAQCAFVKRLLAKYGESLSALFIIVHFEWRGLNGTDEAIHKRLENSGYPVMWINSALYYGFVKNHLGITTEKQTQEKLNDVLLTIIPKDD